MDAPSLVAGPSPLWCRALGRLALYADLSETRALMGAGKPLAILAYLALSAKGRAQRDHVADLFWPGVPLADARHDLRQVLYRLHQLADGCPPVRTIGTELGLSPDIRFDFLDGESAFTTGNLGRACELLRGDFLEGFGIPEATEFERWAEAQRYRFRDTWARAARAAVEERLRAAETEHALALAEELQALRPFTDHPMRLVMTALARSGRQATALARYQAYRELLQSELGERPGEELDSYARELEDYLRSRPSPSESALPFVGRSPQWAVLEASWRAAQEGTGGAVLVEGAAGLGKSRLLIELARWVKAAGGVVLEAKCYDIEQSVPYGAIADALAGIAQRPEVAGLDGAWLAEASRILPEIRARFPSLPPAERSEGSPASQRRLHQALVRCLETVAEEQPVLVLVDDVHWADLSSLEVFHYMAHRLRQAHVLFVASYRPAELRPEARRFARSLVADRLTSLVVLEPLTQEAVAELLCGLAAFDAADVAGAVTEHLHRASAGNPLFLSELLQALGRGGTLSVHDGRWRLASGARIADLPRTLGKLMADRLDRLAPWMRAVVETLAVAADMASIELVAHALQVSEPRAELAVSVLEEERLVRRAGGGAWELVHDELRRLVYQGIPDERRKLLHAAVGSALEEGAETIRPGGAARLAHHFDQAGDLERAHRYALRAAEEAGALAADEVARAHLNLAAAHAPRALPPAASTRARSGWRALARTREVRPSALVAAIAVVGGGAVGAIYFGPAAPAARGAADFRHGALFFGQDGVHTGATHQLRWPSGTDTLGTVQKLRQAPPGFPPTLVIRNAAEGNETHSKVFLIKGADTIQLTSGLSDDLQVEWAPDGRHFLLARGWRVGPTRYQQNLFLVDSSGRVLRPLTHTRYQDQLPTWSSTGTRFTFDRESTGVSTIWIADADGAHERNVTERLGLPRTEGRASFSPREDRLAVVYPDTGAGLGTLYVVDLVDTVARSLIPATRGLREGALWSRDGRWLAYLTRRGEQHALWVVAVDGTRGPSLVALVPTTLGLSAWVDGEPKYASRVTIEPDTISLAAGLGRRVAARVTASDGTPLTTVLRWRVADTSVARVDEIGFVRGRAPGRTFLVASAGGFRADTAIVNVSFGSVDTLLYEDWSAGLDTARWIPFGYPRPVIIARATPEGRPAFLNNGDYNHGSGAVSAARFDVGQEGLTIEVDVGIRLTGMHWQILGVRVDPSPFTAGSQEVSGGNIGIGVQGHSRTVRLPAWDCADVRIPDPALLRTGWRRLLVVLRPDGWFECWADGRLLGKAEVPVEARGVPLHLVLRGHSVGTRLYHGRVLVRRGVGS